MTYREVRGTTSKPTADEVFELRQDGRTVYATDRTGLVEAIIDGYDQHDDTIEGVEDAYFARWQAANTLALNVQKAIFSAYVSTGVVKFEDFAQDDLDTLFPQELDEDPGPFEGVWDSPMPRVLVATDYAPYTNRAVPTGNVEFIDPYTETTFLDTVAATGLFELVVHGE